MANALHRTNKKYYQSVDISELPGTPDDYIRNPDMSAVEGYRDIYWVIDGDSVSLMTEEERNSLDIQIAADRLATKRATAKDMLLSPNNPELVAHRATLKLIYTIVRGLHLKIQEIITRFKNGNLSEIEDLPAPRSFAQIEEVVKSQIDSGAGES